MKTSQLLPALPAPATSHQWFWLDAGDAPNPKVLMIEDDLTIAMMYRHQLRTEGYEVALATDGASGLHLAEAEPPDLILLDIRLPRMGGLDVLKALKADPRLNSVPVLALSNYSDAAIVREAMTAGAADYLLKAQTTPAQLAARMRDLLSK